MISYKLISITRGQTIKRKETHDDFTFRQLKKKNTPRKQLKINDLKENNFNKTRILLYFSPINILFVLTFMSLRQDNARSLIVNNNYYNHPIHRNVTINSDTSMENV